MKQIFNILTCLLISSTVFAQAPKVKFGEITLAELTGSKFPSDPDAPAVILFDKGSVEQFYSKDGFVIEYERHTRIKIFSKTAFELANQEILLDMGDEVLQFKGACYNLEDGKIVTTKLAEENVFEEKLTPRLTLKKAAMPNVKEGSVLEFKYKLRLFQYTLPIEKWVFQHAYAPTLWSEFEASIPTFIEYRKFYQGWTSFYFNEDKIVEEHEAVGSSVIKYSCNYLHYSQQNVPALKPEDYVASVEDYLSQISLDIRAVYKIDVATVGSTRMIINSKSNKLNDSWESVGKDLWENYFEDSFKKQFDPGVSLQALTAGKSSPIDKATAVFEYIGNNYQVSGKDRWWRTQSVQDLTRNKKGGPTDLNLLYINMLQKVDVPAYPVLISTRSHGRPFDFRISTRQFDRIITALMMEDSSYFLIDASAWPNPIGVLPEQALNNQGFIIQSAKVAEWIPLKSSVPDRTALVGEFEIHPDGMISGSLNFSESGHNAVKAHQGLSGHDTLQVIKEHFNSVIGDGQANLIKFESGPIWNNPNFKGTFQVETSAFTQPSGDKIYLNPLLGLGLPESPFKNPDRKFGVDFGSPASLNYVFYFKVPSGYHLEETPASVKLSLGENALTFDYILDKSDPLRIKITVKNAIRKPFIPIDDYPELQNFFQAMVAKMAEKIVLSK